MTLYEQGFMDKCAELGVDPVALLKLSAYSDTSPAFRRVIPDDWEAVDTALTPARIAVQLAKQRGAYGIEGGPNALSEVFGNVTAPLTSGVTGAALGAALSKNRVAGAVGGGLAGFAGGAVAGLIGSIVAGIRRRRTAEEQAEHDKGSPVLNYMVPGLAAYNNAKRVGRANAEFGEEIKAYYGGKGGQ